MAELTEGAAACCAPETQSSCCSPQEKASCCDEHPDGSCRCSAGAAAHDVRDQVRRRYAAAALGGRDASCCGGPVSTMDAEGREVFGAALYGDRDAAPAGAVGASLGCGVPTAVADLHPGETVLDLGSGAGTDVLISARRVAPGGRAIGLDMTDEVLSLARANAAQAGVDNVEFVKATSRRSRCRTPQ
jgi:arsenite methyltransferase